MHSVSTIPLRHCPIRFDAVTELRLALHLLNLQTRYLHAIDNVRE